MTPRTTEASPRVYARAAGVACLALLFRSAEAVVGATTVLISLAVLHVLQGRRGSSTLDAEQLQALAGSLLDVRTAGLDIVLVFIGLGSLIESTMEKEPRSARVKEYAFLTRWVAKLGG